MNQVIATIKDIEILSSPDHVPYNEALAWMENRVESIISGKSAQSLWLLEHPPLYTAGTSANMADLLSHEFPVYQAGRGGQLTYHGPGQRIVYTMLDLSRRPAPKTRDLRAYVCDLEKWLIATLAQFGIKGETRKDRIGVWVVQPDGREDKIAAIGIRVRKYVAFHGIALNVNPNLAHFAGIVPCGIRDHGVTSLHALGIKASLAEVDKALLDNFEQIFYAVGNTSKSENDSCPS